MNSFLAFLPRKHFNCAKLSGNDKFQNLFCIFHTHQCAQKVKKKLEPFSAQGPDGILAEILLDFQDVLAGSLSSIFNVSMQEGTVQEDWRCANVTVKSSSLTPVSIILVSISQL